MFDYFNQYIKPANDKLGEMLGIKKIAVAGFSYPEPVTVQVLTIDGDLDACNHAGAYEQIVDDSYFTLGEWHERTRQVMACNKCNKWTLDGVEWEN